MDKNSSDLNDLRETVESVITDSPFAIQSLNENRKNIRLVLSYKNNESTDGLEQILDIIKKIGERAKQQTISVSVKGVVKRIEDHRNITFSIDPNGPIEIE